MVLPIAFVASILALVMGAWLYRAVISAPTSTQRADEIAAAISAGASAFLNRQYRTVAMVGVPIFFLIGLVLGWSAIRFKVEGHPLAEKIDAILPQTQCGQCGFPGCRPYAEAIANGEAPINQCPPGGQATIVALADLLDTEVLELKLRSPAVRARYPGLVIAHLPPFWILKFCSPQVRAALIAF